MKGRDEKGHFAPGNDIGQQVGPGNDLAITHGARSISVINSALPGVVEEIRDALAESIPALQPIDSLVLEQLARTVVELRLMQKYVDDRGGSPIDSRGRPRAMWRQYSAAHTRFMKYSAMLGISPAGRASLMRDAGAGQRDYEAAQASRDLRDRYSIKQLPEEGEVDE